MSADCGAASHRLEDYAFEYPASLIARAPASPRDSARLLVLDRRGGPIEHRLFSDLAQYLRPGDCLVLNRSRVLPARLVGRKPTGGKVELLLLRELEPGRWLALSADLKRGQTALFPEGFTADAVECGAGGEWELSFSGTDVAGLMERHGEAPLPPYILRARRGEESPRDDRSDYQAVYARESGSIAAPTAGLHFTAELLSRVRASGVAVAELILHVGLGTFRPVLAPDVREHKMLPERFELPADSAEAIARTRLRGGRIVAVGTTSVRTLESLCALRRSGENGGDRGALRDGYPRSGSTELFILPGHRFGMIDALVTNFHQPASTPLLLSCAFAGRERLLAAYREAIERNYRLFSYGDAMLIT